MTIIEQLREAHAEYLSLDGKALPLRAATICLEYLPKLLAAAEAVARYLEAEASHGFKMREVVYRGGGNVVWDSAAKAWSLVEEAEKEMKAASAALKSGASDV